jgi:hypothetical protein
MFHNCYNLLTQEIIIEKLFLFKINFNQKYTTI